MRKVNEKFLESETWRDLTPRAKYTYFSLLALADNGLITTPDGSPRSNEDLKNLLLFKDDLEYRIIIFELAAEKLLGRIENLFYLPQYENHVEVSDE